MPQSDDRTVLIGVLPNLRVTQACDELNASPRNHLRLRSALASFARPSRPNTATKTTKRIAHRSEAHNGCSVPEDDSPAVRDSLHHRSRAPLASARTSVWPKRACFAAAPTSTQEGRPPRPAEARTTEELSPRHPRPSMGLCLLASEARRLRGPRRDVTSRRLPSQGANVHKRPCRTPSPRLRRNARSMCSKLSTGWTCALQAATGAPLSRR